MQKPSPLTHHPCFSNQAHHVYGRIHLPVAPRCNLACAYCHRKYDCVNESRPGVTSKILSPQQAIEHLKHCLLQEPKIKVVGIAGPGESLCNKETFETLQLVKKTFPNLLTCVSTNGLLLKENIARLVDCEVDTLTVTINTLSEKTGAIIYPTLKNLPDFLKNQQQGLLSATKQGFTVKVNTVLIPGVNEDEVAAIGKFAAQSGAHIMNVIPLIPCGKMKNYLPPLPACWKRFNLLPNNTSHSLHIVNVVEQTL